MTSPCGPGSSIATRGILEEELKERPDEPFILFNLGAIAIERKDWMGALGYLRGSLTRSAPTDSITRKLFALIARSHQMMGDTALALRACAEGLSFDAEDAELWFRKGVVHRQRGESAEAESCWRRILGLTRPERFASLDMGIYGHLTRRNLAVLARSAATPRRRPGSGPRSCPNALATARHGPCASG